MAPVPVNDDVPVPGRPCSPSPPEPPSSAEKPLYSPRLLALFFAFSALFLLELAVPSGGVRSHPTGLGSLHLLRPPGAGPPTGGTYGLGWHYLTSAAAVGTAGDGAVLASVPAWVLAPSSVYSAPPAQQQEQSFWDAHAAGLATAQDGEDEYAYLNFFYGQSGGVVLESGALDGVTYSVSRYFVFARGWRAIHVEGSPTSYARLVANRPESLNLHTALCNASRTLHYAVNPNVPATSGFWEFIPAWIRTGFYKDVEVDLAKMPLVPCRPLGPLLELYGVGHINLWVLDVEGAEEEVLTSVDFLRLRVDVIVAELDGGNAEKDERCHRLLLAAGYVFHKAIVRNRWYVHSSFVPSAAPQGTFSFTLRARS
jgi:hypothetical protein